MSERSFDKARPGDRRDTVRRRSGHAVLAAACAAIGWTIGFAVGRLGLYTLLIAVAVAVALAVISTRADRDPRATRGANRALESRKRLLFGTLAVLVAWLGFELLVAAGVRTNPTLVWRLGVRRPGDGPGLLGREQLRKAYQTQFDADLGWDHPPRGPARATALVSAYGDSFTECTGPDNLTWEALLADSIRADVINFGVGAYGTDQALIKLKRLYPRYRTPIVLFGFLPRDISRIVNVYGFARLVQETRTFLLNGTPYFMPTKPRYELADGQLRLLQNPVRSEADFMRLVYEPGFAETLSAHDYFKQGYVLDRFVPEISFPYALTIPRALIVRGRQTGPPPDYASILMQDSGATQLLARIFDEFVSIARRDSFTGVVVLFGEPDELLYYLKHGRHSRLEPVVRYLNEKGYPYIDTVDLLARQQRTATPAESPSVYYDATSHHSAYAHKIIAQGIHRYLAPSLANLQR